MTTKTPYAVICPTDGVVYLTNRQYDYQMEHAEALWICPKCNKLAEWDQDNYEKYYGDDKDYLDNEVAF